jgi:hypothetical protein
MAASWRVAHPCSSLVSSLVLCSGLPVTVRYNYDNHFLDSLDIARIAFGGRPSYFYVESRVTIEEIT